MAKEIKDVEVKEVKTNARWEAFLERYKAQNPAKYALREAAGEFKKVPDSFK